MNVAREVELLRSARALVESIKGKGDARRLIVDHAVAVSRARTGDGGHALPISPRRYFVDSHPPNAVPSPVWTGSTGNNHMISKSRRSRYHRGMARTRSRHQVDRLQLAPRPRVEIHHPNIIPEACRILPTKDEHSIDAPVSISGECRRVAFSRRRGPTRNGWLAPLVGRQR